MKNKLFIKYRIKNSQNKGVILVNSLIILLVLVFLGVTLISVILANSAYINKLALNTKALYIAEAGIDKAVVELNKSGDYTGETTDLGEGRFQVIIQDESSSVKIVTSTGYIPKDPPYKSQRTVKVKVFTSPSEESVSFNYAVQTNDLGLLMYANSVINGSVYSNGSITGYSNTRINGDAYAVGTISSPRPQVSGTTNPGSPLQPFPSIDIDFWKNQANINNDPIIGNYELNGESATMGPRKIEGTLTLNSNSILTLTGPLHVTGNFEMNSNTHLYLDEGFGSKGTVIIVDGTIRMNSNSIVHTTSADPKSYILLLSTSTSSLAVELNSNTLGGVYYAPNGTIQLNSNADIVAVVGRGLTLNSNAELNYDSGLASSIFSSGPGGSWRIKKGSWERI